MSAVGSPQEYWSTDSAELLETLATRLSGLTPDEVESRLVHRERNVGLRRESDVRLLVRQFRSPLLLLLLVASMVSLFFAERLDSAIILAIVFGSGILGFVQERGAVRAIEALRELVTFHVDVLRDGRLAEVGFEEVVPGDIVMLDVGDVVPGDCIVLEANRLTVDESTLTGEAFPIQKRPGIVAARSALDERSNCLHLGSHVASGTGTAVVVTVGAETQLGIIGGRIAHHHLPTAFERGITAYGFLLVKATAVLVTGVFILNLIAHRGVAESILFSLALAVGLTPQMLPAIVTLSLSVGARLLARRKVVVKRLDAIEDFGSVDVLCSDKTGTLTEGTVRLVDALDFRGDPSALVLERAYWNAHLQVGHSNPIDRAIIESVGHSQALPAAVDEVPFDFVRKLVSVVVSTPEGQQLVCKGAVERVLERCSRVRLGTTTESIDVCSEEIVRTFRRLSSAGFRTLAIAERELSALVTRMSDLEQDMVFLGFLTLEDPIKNDVDAALRSLKDLGITVKIITGDNREITRHTAHQVGLSSENLVTGTEIAEMNDEQLRVTVDRATLFAEVDPGQKERIVRTLSKNGHSVAFVGDGVNDAAALHAADVGISVDSGVDVAKESADLILLDKSLQVISDGITHGRRVFVNTLKYVYVTTSANFGNMVSLACATLFLPYLPMLPLQILLLNFLSDVPGMMIATDNVDGEMLARPQRWNIDQVRRFMIVFGLLSTTVDLLTFIGLRMWLDEGADGLRTGWFFVSVLTEIIAILFLRTARPVFRSRPSRSLTWSSLAVVTVSALLVMTAIGEPFRFVVLPLGTVAVLVGLVGLYALGTELLKGRFSDLFSGAEN